MDLQAYGGLAVDVGVALEPGQVLFVDAFVDSAPLVRAVADAAYRRGARYVDVVYSDKELQATRIAHAGEDTLGFVPDWLLERLDAMRGNAIVSISGTPIRGASSRSLWSASRLRARPRPWRSSSR
jgi:aminopeptidase